MRKKKEDIFVIILAAILVVIVFGIVFTIITSQQQPQNKLTATSTIITPKTPSPTISENTAGGVPPLTYDKAASQKLLDYIDNRRALSSSDTFAKANILSLLPSGQQSGIVYQSSNIIIEYISSADVFQTEILTTDIQAAKNEANAWFREHGVSQKGICTLPVEFYMNHDVANTMRQENLTFSPLPNGC